MFRTASRAAARHVTRRTELLNRPFRCLVTTALVFAVLVSGSGCQSEARIQPREVIRVSIDNLNASEMMLVRTYQQALPNLEFKIVESSGSVMTVESIQRGKADVGVASADVAFHALVG